MAVLAEAEMDEVERRAEARPRSARRPRRGRPSSTGIGRRSGRASSGSAARSSERFRSGCPGGATRSSTWKIDDALPRDLLLPERLEEPCAAAHGEREPVLVLSSALGDQSGDSPDSRLGVGQHLESEGHLGFSRCPPNAARIAESSRFAKSASSRDVKRE